MHKSQQQVREFHLAFNYPTSPAEPQIRNGDFRANLILEEAIETAIALVGAARAQTIVQHQLHSVLQTATRTGKTEPDLVEAIDGLCDLKYVTEGAFESIGIDGELFFDEVHRSNMAKVGGPVDANGKQLKPEGWTAPDIAGVLANEVPPPRESCACDGAFDDGCYSCTEKWRCPICRFPVVMIKGVIKGVSFQLCAHCANQKFTAEEWREIAAHGQLTDEQASRIFGESKRTDATTDR